MLSPGWQSTTPEAKAAAYQQKGSLNVRGAPKGHYGPGALQTDTRKMQQRDEKKKKEQQGSVHHQTRHGFAWASQVRGLLVHGPTHMKTLHTKLRLWSWHLLSVVRGAGIYENQTHSILGGLWLQNSLLFASKSTTVLRSYFAPQVTNFKMLARNYKW